jgi:hypothetical protein
MTRTEAVLVGAGVVGALAVGAIAMAQRSRNDPVATRIDPQGDGVHRQSRPPWAIDWTERLPSNQERSIRDAGYPHTGDAAPSAYAQMHPVGPGMGPIGYGMLDYGDAPIRVPRLYKDAIRFWDGLCQRGSTQQNYRMQMAHLRPSQPTRGYRSVSGVLAGQGPTNSRSWIPAIFTPSTGS